MADQQTRTAWHEAAHATAQVHLLGPESVDAISIRRGKGHLGVTLLASPPTDRRERELGIVAVLSGDIAERWAVPITSYRGESDAEAAAAAAVASLDELAPLTHERLLEAEDDEAPVADESVAERSAWLLADWGGGMEAALHVAYLRAVAAGFVERHAWAIRRVAEALLEHETLDGAAVAQIVRGTRCVCHGWTPPDDKESARVVETP